MKTDLSAVLRAVQWDPSRLAEDAALYDAVLPAYQEALMRRLGGLLAAYNALTANANPLLDECIRANEAAVRELLTSPALAGALLLCGEHPADVKATVHQVVKPLLATGPADGPPAPGYDRVDGLLVNYASDVQMPYMDRGGNDLRLLDAEGRDQTRERVRLALGVVDRLHNASYLVRGYALELYPRKELGGSGSFCSGSVKHYPGLVYLGNPDSPAADCRKVADALVHESIHSLLNMFEHTHGHFNRDALTDIVTSPWSGARLNLDVYVHAVFVWFGLYCFWTRQEDEVLTRRARRGFDSGLVAGIVHPYRHALAHGMYERIAEIEDLVRSERVAFLTPVR